MKETIVKLLTILVFLPQILFCQTEKKETLYFAQFNIENLFDAVDDPAIDDSEFLPESEKFWTEGKEKSDVNREAAAKYLRIELNDLFEKEPNANVILLGDFNDEPRDKSVTRMLKADDFSCGEEHETNSLFNLAYKKAENEEGSYLYAKNWDMIDQIIISSALNDGKKLEYECDSYEVVKPKFMIIESGSRAGGALPTYMGSKYIGGYSDHFPVGARFYFKTEKN